MSGSTGRTTLLKVHLSWVDHWRVGVFELIKHTGSRGRNQATYKHFPFLSPQQQDSAIGALEANISSTRSTSLPSMGMKVSAQIRKVSIIQLRYTAILSSDVQLENSSSLLLGVYKKIIILYVSSMKSCNTVLSLWEIIIPYWKL